MKNIIDVIEEQMLSDDVDRDDQAEYLAKAYKISPTAVNEALLALCGWEYDSLLKLSKE